MKSGSDYSEGLAGIIDTVFNAHDDEIVANAGIAKGLLIQGEFGYFEQNIKVI